MADNEKLNAEEVAPDYLDILLAEVDEDILIHDANNPQNIDAISELVGINQAAAQEIEFNRQRLYVDEKTGEEVYGNINFDPTPIGRTWQYDFVTEEFVMGKADGTPVKVENDDFGILSQWIHRAITTERYRYSAYPDWYGVEMEPVFSGDLTGLPALNHVRSTMRDAIMMHDRITAVENIEVAEDGGTIWFSCDVFVDNHEEAKSLSFVFEGGELTSG